MNKLRAVRYVKEEAFKKVIQTLATKKDLERFASKEDLKELTKQFATKDDLKRFATKDDLKNHPTNEQFDRLVTLVIKNSRDIEEMKPVLYKTSADVSLILDRIDAFAGKMAVVDRKDTVHDHRLNELESQTGDHERRIAALESRKP